MDAFTNRAWLLSITGKAISVLHHPAANFEFYNIPVILLEHGSELEQEIARGFIDHPTEEQKHIVLALYHKNWCKVRVWGCFSEEVLFRIPEHNGHCCTEKSTLLRHAAAHLRRRARGKKRQLTTCRRCGIIPSAS